MQFACVHRRINNRTSVSGRSGVMLVLVAIALTSILIVSAFAINVSYMQMVRVELRIASDAAAKAAILELHRTQDPAKARTFARLIAGENPIRNRVLELPDSSIQFGNSKRDSNGVYQFSSGIRPFNSARVLAEKETSLLWGKPLGLNSFTPHLESIAMRINHDIVLVLDRSASMSFDLTSSEFAYAEDRQEGTPAQAYFEPPSQVASRWQLLRNATEIFLQTLQERQLDAQLALVTFSQQFEFGQYRCETSSLDVPLTKNYDDIMAQIQSWNQKVLLGDTNIAAGLEMGRTALDGPGSRMTAHRTMVIITDGVPTAGRLDLDVIAEGYRNDDKMIIHVITFGDQALVGGNQSRMLGIAESAYGQYFHAPDSVTLNEAFLQISQSLPSVLIE